MEQLSNEIVNCPTEEEEEEDENDDNDNDSTSSNNNSLEEEQSTTFQPTTSTSSPTTSSSSIYSTTNNLYTTEIVKSKFGPSVGRVTSSYPCSLRGSSGRLYASSNSLCFYSNLFGFERCAHLKLVDVVKLEGNGRGGAIHVTIVKKGEEGEGGAGKKGEERRRKEYTFRGFGTSSERDVVLMEIRELWGRKVPHLALADEEEEEEEDKEEVEANHIYDPESKEEEEEEEDNNNDEGEERTPTTTSYEEKTLYSTSASSSSKTNTTNNSSPTPTNPQNNTNNTMKQLRSLFLPGMRSNSDTYTLDTSAASSSPKKRTGGTMIHSAPPSFLKTPKSSSSGEEEEEEEGDDVGGVEMNEMTLSRGSEGGRQRFVVGEEGNGGIMMVEEKEEEEVVNVGVAWKRLKEVTEEYMKDVALEKLDLSCNLDTFYNNFFADDASHSIDSFQKEKIGDFDIEVAPWTDPEKDDEGGDDDDDENDYNQSGATVDKVRTFTFTHPLNNALGPTSAKTKKIQRFRRFGSYGMCLDAKTTVHGVPSADAFYVEDRWLIENRGVNNGNEGGDNEKKGLTMRAKFKITFVKGTMFRGIIDKNTKVECKSWFEGYSKMLLTALAGEEKAISTPSPPPPAAAAEEQIKEIEVERKLTLFGIHIPMETFMVIIVVLILALAVLFGYNMSLRTRVNILEEEMNVWRGENIMLMKEMRDMIVLLHREAVGSRSILQTALSSQNPLSSDESTHTNL